MLLLYVMMTLIKLICVNTALSSKTDQDGEGLCSWHEHDFNATPAGDDDVQSCACQYSFFSNNWKKEK